MKFEKSCGAVVYRNIDNNLEFLAVKSKCSDQWGFPKGHVEFEETEEETAKREVWEEAGINIDIIDGFKMNINYNIKKDIKKEVIFFLAKLSEKPAIINFKEIHEYKWDNFENMLNLLTYNNQKDILKKAYNFLQNKIN
ncbi:MAG: NUDIX domain-containing protein [Clostridium argentinense]|uniref:Bis(5'-nucleosyl)-tetraphosphatase [asymmetrical] n=1 Tax=Clostridium faecium TaxID=2762223 RepID=A0ABR8YTE4_9CLOT|nr:MULTISPECIES: NUDIX domain-containing protein [Clostridium]MBD8047258.1 NUDIX domain-containing protein [Clostridium faecium]MBS5822522.1 NUDIX domain-containing protein [Clostridium argentinense]MDU1347961.1 NUDIX domain-containing protein [Clostridium argentinense]